jgi:hypothetical protein
MKKIVFTASEPEGLDYATKIVPGSTIIPEWYKKQPSFDGGKMQLSSESGIPNSTIKKCMPVLDDMTAGYYFLCQSDLQVTNNSDGTKSIVWSQRCPYSLISTHSLGQISNVPIPPEFDRQPFKFQNPWHIKTPPGYSCMFRQTTWIDTPFRIFSGIVDTDRHPVAVHFPFVVRSDFEGMIAAGTPLVQIIPFRRTEWQHEVVDEWDGSGNVEYNVATRRSMHLYKDNWRSKKKWK